VVKKFLEEEGYSVVDTTSGKKGLKLFQDETFDPVLSDITMPDTDGIKLISKLKSIDPETKLVVLTGHVAEEKLEAARRAGAEQILTKPFKKEDLYRAIVRALFPGTPRPI
jgi:CheY-like chemotaxis protein